MILDKAVNTVFNNSADSHNVTITEEAASHIIMSLTKNLYSHPRQAFLRETISNAQDANIEAGNPNALINIELSRYKIVISDCGKGITKERFNDIYVNLGNSTKRETNDQIGKYGYGRFAALAVSNNVFIITKPGDGYVYVYNMYIDEDNIKIDLCTTTPYTGPTGTSVYVSFSDTGITSELDYYLHYDYSFFPNIGINSVYSRNLSTIKAISKSNCHFGYFSSNINHTRYLNRVLINNLLYENPIYNTYKLPDSLAKVYENDKIDASLMIPRFNANDVEYTPSRENIVKFKNNDALYKKYLDILHFLHPELKDFMPPKVVSYTIKERYNNSKLFAYFQSTNDSNFANICSIAIRINKEYKRLPICYILNEALLYNKKIILYKGRLNKKKVDAIYNMYSSTNPVDLYIVNTEARDITTEYDNYIIKYLYKKNRFVILHCIPELENLKTEKATKNAYLYDLEELFPTSTYSTRYYTRVKMSYQHCLACNVVVIQDKGNHRTDNTEIMLTRIFCSTLNSLKFRKNIFSNIPEITFCIAKPTVYKKLTELGIPSISEFLLKNNFYVQSILLLLRHKTLKNVLCRITENVILSKMFSEHGALLQRLQQVAECIPHQMQTSFRIGIKEEIKKYNINSFSFMLKTLQNIIYNSPLFLYLPIKTVPLYYINKFKKYE